METLIAVAFLLPLGVALYKLILWAMRTRRSSQPAEEPIGLGRALMNIFGNGRELALFALFEAAAVAAMALSLAAFGPRVSVIALLVCLALFILFAWKPPPKAR